jgi:hypothetical protein
VYLGTCIWVQEGGCIGEERRGEERRGEERRGEERRGEERRREEKRREEKRREEKRREEKRVLVPKTGLTGNNEMPNMGAGN